MTVSGEVDRVDMWSNSIANINGTLTVGAGGIHVASLGPSFITGGVLTSSVGKIQFNLKGSWPDGSIFIDSTIKDNGKQRVGLNVKSVDNNGFGVIYLRGKGSNTFTGDVVIEGYNELSLEKTNGTAVQGNAYAVDGGVILSLRSGNIARNTIVGLKGKGSRFGFHSKGDLNITESFHRLEVEGRGTLTFWHSGRHATNSYRTLYLDDLMVKEGGWLTIHNWKEGFAKLLVRKDSEHLQEALGRLAFDGYRLGGELREFNKDYWEITGLPESAAYGAGLMLGAIGIVRYRRWRQCRRPHA